MQLFFHGYGMACIRSKQCWCTNVSAVQQCTRWIRKGTTCRKLTLEQQKGNDSSSSNTG
uniref:Uncharacterized protein n=1 Tax=Arundo donax TaxID=35708 RepID=A0A0A9D2H8_ARUDO